MKMLKYIIMLTLVSTLSLYSKECYIDEIHIEKIDGYNNYYRYLPNTKFINPDTGKEDFEREHFDGLMVVKFRDNTIAYEHTFKDGYRSDGVYKEYFENGNIKYKAIYKDKLLLEDEVYYQDKNNLLNAHTKYNNEGYRASYVSYYKDGKLKEKKMKDRITRYKKDGTVDSYDYNNGIIEANFFGDSKLDYFSLERDSDDRHIVTIYNKDKKYNLILSDKVNIGFFASAYKYCEDIDSGYNQVHISIPPMHSDLPEDYQTVVVYYDQKKDKLETEIFDGDIDLSSVPLCSIKAYRAYKKKVNAKKQELRDVHRALLGDIKRLDVDKLKLKPQKINVNKISNAKIEKLMKMYPNNFWDTGEDGYYKFYKENGLSYLKFVNIKFCDSYGALMIKRDGDKEWNAIYDIPGGCSKVDLYNPDIVEIQKDYIIMRVCHECNWWGTYSFVKIDLNNFEISYIEEYKRED